MTTRGGHAKVLHPAWSWRLLWDKISLLSGYFCLQIYKLCSDVARYLIAVYQYIVAVAFISVFNLFCLCRLFFGGRVHCQGSQVICIWCQKPINYYHYSERYVSSVCSTFVVVTATFLQRPLWFRCGGWSMHTLLFSPHCNVHLYQTASNLATTGY